MKPLEFTPVSSDDIKDDGSPVLPRHKRESPAVIASATAIAAIALASVMYYFPKPSIEWMWRDDPVGEMPEEDREEVVVPTVPIDKVIADDEFIPNDVATDMRIEQFVDPQDERDKLKITAVRGNLKINEQITALEGCTVVVDKDK